MDTEKNLLRVLEAYTRDVGLGVARIEEKMMADLEISKGDIVEIKGKRTTAARCLPSLTPQQLEAEQRRLTQLREKLHKTGTGESGNETRSEWPKRNVPTYEMKPIIPGKTIRMDGMIRNNAGINIGDTVTIRKIVLSDAKKVTVVPLENMPPIDERYLSDALQKIPVTKGDNIMVPYFGVRLTFNVTDVAPGPVSVVTQDTVFSITTQGTTLRAVGDFKYYSNGKEFSFALEHAVRKENPEYTYLIMKIHLHHGGFIRVGQFQARLDKDSSIQDLVLKYKKGAEEAVKDANRKLAESTNVNSVDLINNLEFEVLEKWRAIP